MSRWPQVPLGDLVTVVGGGTPARGNAAYWGGGIPWASVKDLKGPSLSTTQESVTRDGIEQSATTVVPPGSIIVATRMGLGKVAMNTVPIAINQDLKALICSPRVASRYLLHFLVARSQQFVALGNGATVKGITLDQLSSFRVPLPPLAEQRRIAAVLDVATRIARGTHQRTAMVSSLRRSVFIHMFGEPFATYRGGIAWPEVELRDITTDAQYGTSVKASKAQRGFPVVRMSNLTVDGDIDLAVVKWCEVPERDVAKYTLRPRDMLFNRTNSPELVGKSAVWCDERSYVFAGYLVRLRFDEKRVLPEFVSACLNSVSGKRLLRSRAKHSINMSNISAGDLLRISIPVPPISLQREYADRQAIVRDLRSQLNEVLRPLETLTAAMSARFLAT